MKGELLMYTVEICHLYPELLNLYGDKGNVIALKKRCEWRDINVIVHNVSLGDEFIPDKYDIVFIGSGQSYEHEIIRDDLLTNKGPAVKDAIESNKVFLAISGGFQLLGKYCKTVDDRELEFLGALDLWTISSQERMIGNIILECGFLKNENFDGKIVGFENHSGKTYLGNGVKPLGKVVNGYGNNGEDGNEGAVYKNVYCSYLHGSLLPKNPALTDYLLETALNNKYRDFGPLPRLDDSLEIAASKSMINRIIKK